MFIILPSLIIGILKLRRRDLSLLLEASGWAINGPMRLSLNLAHSLTEVAELPPGSLRLPRFSWKRELRRVRLLWWLLLAVALAYFLSGLMG